MWWRLVTSGNLVETLGALGVPEAVSSFVEQSDNAVKPFYVQKLKQNPGLTVEELRSMPAVGPKGERRVDPQGAGGQTPPYDAFVQQFSSDPEFQRWVSVQLRKMYRLTTENGYQQHVYVFGGASYTMATVNHKLVEIHDWVKASRRHAGLDAQGNSRFQIATYDFETALALSNEWHAVVAGQGAGKMYGPTEESRVVYRFGGEHQGYTVQQVVTKNDLQAEGSFMNHCVGSYCEDVESGRQRIFSLRDDSNRPLATISMAGDRNTIYQIQANSNSEPPQEIKALLKEWLSGVPDATWEHFDDEPDFSEYEFEDYDDAIRNYYFKGDDYGIKADISSASPVSLYETVLQRFQRGDNWRGNRDGAYNHDMSRSARPIAEVAVARDKAVMAKYVKEGEPLSPQRLSIHHLLEAYNAAADMANDRFHEQDFGYDLEGAYDRPVEPDPGDYDGGHEDPDFVRDHEVWSAEHERWREEKLDEWASEYDSDARNYLPYGFISDIVDEIGELTSADPEYADLMKRAVHEVDKLDVSRFLPSEQAAA